MITIGRIILVPFAIWLIVTGQFLWAFAVFIIAGISDGVDGFIAKRFDLATRLGAYLDPLADKLLLVSMYLALGFLGKMSALLVIIVVSRDVMIVGAVILSWVLDKPIEMRPLWISKVNTAGQILFAGLILAGLGFGVNIDLLSIVGGFLVGTLTIASGAAYMRDWIIHMSNGNGLQASRGDNE